MDGQAELVWFVREQDSAAVNDPHLGTKTGTTQSNFVDLHATMLLPPS